MSYETIWFISFGLFCAFCVAMGIRGLWLDNYYDKYNEHYADAKRRGTVGKFRNTQFNP
jgi:hypothetical protein